MRKADGANQQIKTNDQQNLHLVLAVCGTHFGSSSRCHLNPSVKSPPTLSTTPDYPVQTRSSITGEGFQTARDIISSRAAPHRPADEIRSSNWCIGVVHQGLRG